MNLKAGWVLTITLLHTLHTLLHIPVSFKFNQIKHPVLSAVLVSVTLYLHTFTPSHLILERNRGIIFVM